MNTTTIQTTPVVRTFLYGGRTLPDPGVHMSPEEVKHFYSSIHADLTTAAVEGGEFDGDTQVWHFRRNVGTKG